MSNHGRPRHESRDLGDDYKLAKWLLNAISVSGLSNEDVAHQLGYARGNIVSMWCAGRTRIPLNQLQPLSKIFKTDLELLLQLWLNQYVDPEHNTEYASIFRRMCTENEGLILDEIRGHFDGSVPELPKKKRVEIGKAAVS